MTKAELIEKLTEAGSGEPQSEAKIILEELFGVSASVQMAERDRDYSTERLTPLIERRRAHEPLQYILGYAYFCSEKYDLSPETLIPRPDTEMLVTAAVRLIEYKGRFLDLCTGSGCVAISTLARRPDMSAAALDISEGAISMARKNAAENGVADRVEFICSDLRSMPVSEEFDAILSNPPYIPSSVVDTLSAEVSHEPRIALDGGADGMDYYRFIVENYQHNLKTGGFLAFEIGYDQKEAITSVAEENGMECEIAHDYSGNPRVAVLRRRAECEQDSEDGQYPMHW